MITRSQGPLGNAPCEALLRVRKAAKLTTADVLDVQPTSTRRSWRQFSLRTVLFSPYLRAPVPLCEN
jgi:hypothetical protein